MSSSSYYQALQSCLEPTCLVEECILKLKVAPFKSNNSRLTSDHTNVDSGGWSFLHLLATNASQNTNKVKVYDPPSRRRSPISEKSLEMCTESLGTETGCQASDKTNEMSLISSVNANQQAHERSRLRESRRKKRIACFPPRLSSISGSTTIQVKPQREDGRLVLKAVDVPSKHTYFHAERTNGRLRLYLTRDCSNNGHEEEEKAAGTEEQEQEQEQEAYGEKIYEEIRTEDENQNDVDDEELDENSGNSGGEMEMENLPRPSRCKESGSGNKALQHYGQLFCVAT